MYKQVFNMVVTTNCCDKFESVLNNFRIGLNEWDKTRPLIVNGSQLVSYTVICEKSMWDSISNVFMNMVY